MAQPITHSDIAASFIDVEVKKLLDSLLSFTKERTAFGTGTASQVLTSTGADTSPTWQDSQGGGGGGSQPLAQVVFGTGTGVTSDPSLTYDPGSGQMFLAGTSIISSTEGLTIFASDSTGSGIPGGDLNFTAGSGGDTGGGNGGSISFTSGSGASDGGHAGFFELVCGNPTEGDGGSIFLVASNAAGSGDHDGGSVTITAADRVNSGIAGSIKLFIPATGGLLINTDPGTEGYVLTSHGPSAAPTWAPPAGILNGAGVPDDLLGSDGMYYFRSDGDTLSHIYFKSGGTWAGIV